MKKHKILSLLLALVLVFSAAGTAFAATSDSGSWNTPYGVMNGTTAYTASPKSVKVSTSFERSQSFYSIGIQNGIRWLTAETGEYGSATKSNIVVTTSAFKTFDLDSGSVLGWTPIGAQGIHTSYLAVSSNSFTLIEEKETNITF